MRPRADTLHSAMRAVAMRCYERMDGLYCSPKYEFGREVRDVPYIVVEGIADKPLTH